MLRNMDRFAQSDARRLKLGDRARLPLVRLGDDEVYRHTWEIVSFPVRGTNDDPAYCRSMAHCVTIRRLADGLVKTIAQHWFTRYIVPCLRGFTTTEAGRYGRKLVHSPESPLKRHRRAA